MKSIDRCRADVELREGGTQGSALIGSYCGSHQHGSIFTHGNALFIRFNSNTRRPSSGFEARVSIGISCTSPLNL